MAGLSNFLAKNVIPANTTEEFTLSNRFVEYDDDGNLLTDINGNPILAKFTIKALEPSKYMRIATGAVKVSKTGMDLDDGGMTDTSLSLIIESLKVPDLYDRDLQNSYGVLTAVDLIDKMFTTSEIQILMEKINALHRGEGSFEDQVDEVKN